MRLTKRQWHDRNQQLPGEVYHRKRAAATHRQPQKFSINGKDYIALTRSEARAREKQDRLAATPAA